ncbi:hypothetical protein C2G38_2048533 [Gigaspora rosea]|uniref:Uncharacterized protein n=1 Tax=Gigaspora rosea TaxID=44941 RepID=A0A397UAY9_9GLOM|nr:hypothetical protein C2G38_2048533 [Gigaspora rosea]
MGHFKKALNYLLEDKDQNNLDELILFYIAKKEAMRNTQTQLVHNEDNQALSSITLSDGRVYNVDNVEDPIARKGKSRSPNQRLKAFNEKYQASNSKTQQVSIDDVDSENSANRHKCRLFHKTDHYAPRCPNKENNQM